MTGQNNKTNKCQPDWVICIEMTRIVIKKNLMTLFVILTGVRYTLIYDASHRKTDENPGFYRFFYKAKGVSSFDP